MRGRRALYFYHEFCLRSQDSYFVSYQRCCRNETIDNLINPDDVGATYSVEITPVAQSLCNSSPSFDTYPPIIICNNEPLLYDHSASDPDGDQLVYEFCPIIIGGDNNLDLLIYNTCDGDYPSPACPPVWECIFQAPNYTATAPMGGDPLIQIDLIRALLRGGLFCKVSL
ncbi:MAG: hypothetical protein R2795_16640 [Saprospiraceae bacterium]